MKAIKLTEKKKKELFEDIDIGDPISHKIMTEEWTSDEKVRCFKEFTRLMEAFKTLGLSRVTVKDVMRLLLAVILLGDLQFHPTGSSFVQRISDRISNISLSSRSSSSARFDPLLDEDVSGGKKKKKKP